MATTPRKLKSGTYFAQVPLAHVRKVALDPKSAGDPANLVRERPSAGAVLPARTTPVKRTRS